MESTQIAPQKTAQEIVDLLMRAGAVGFVHECSGGRINALTFVLKIDEAEIPYRLPVRVMPIYDILQKRRQAYLRRSNEAKDKEQAERVAWRQLLRWVQAQLAMIDTGMVKAAEVFLPYYRLNDEYTYFEALEASGKLKALPAPTN
jgi:hypothetical protein